MIVDVKHFNANYFYKYKALSKGRGKNAKRYIDCVTAFDIETTTLTDIEQSFMYIWQFNINNEVTIIGRYWNEWLDLLEAIKKVIDGAYLVIYVHNLSYEFQFLKGVYDFEPDEVFVTDPRKILKCYMYDCIEYRCSYFLTNMSLQELTKRYNVKDLKLSGEEFDYSKVRYPWTKLTNKELKYCINDVQGLVQCLFKILELESDTIKSIPMTSTGFVRRDCKRAMRKFNKKELEAMLPDLDDYTLERECIRGGNTHYNRWFSDEIIEDIAGADESSAYPYALLCGQFPSEKFIEDTNYSAKHLRDLLYKYKKPFLCRIAISNIKLKNVFTPVPYLSRDKCRNIVGGVYDNGRILRAEYLETTITDIDFKLILGMYEWQESAIFKLKTSIYKPLPEPLKEVIRKYYVEKTALKGIDGQELYYAKAKARLNSIYGMMATDPVKESIEFRNGGYYLKDEDRADLLKESNKKAFLNYAFGVWCTCIAREALQEGIDLATNNEASTFVYCDTDSIKYIGELDLSELNKKRMLKALKNNAVATDKHGVKHYMGVFEDEGYTKPNRFRSMGAKKYVVEDSTGLHVTIAGVNKKRGGKELGKIENFKEGFTFYKAGGTESKYNDGVYMKIKREGKELIITDNIAIKDSSYTLGVTAEYMDILNGYIDIKYSDHVIYGLYE